MQMPVEIDFRALVMRRRELTWQELRDIDWVNVPVTGSAEHECYSRDIAGYVRNFPEFYTSKEHMYALAVEHWLIRRSQEQSQEQNA